MEILENLKIRLGIAADDTSKDSLLTLKIDDAKDLFMSECNRSDVPLEADNLIAQIAEKLHSAVNNVQSETLGDHSVSYFSEFSEPLKKQFGKFRLVRIPK